MHRGARRAALIHTAMLGAPLSSDAAAGGGIRRSFYKWTDVNINGPMCDSQIGPFMFVALIETCSIHTAPPLRRRCARRYSTILPDSNIGSFMFVALTNSFLASASR